VLVGAAGAGVLVGGQFATGALLGVGAALLFSKKSGPELREELRRRGRELLGSRADLPDQLWRRGKEWAGSGAGMSAELWRRGREVLGGRFTKEQQDKRDEGASAPPGQPAEPGRTG
jgi:gas vesicle protein